MHSHRSVLYILITAFCFGTMEVALKIGGTSFAPLQMNFHRFLIGGITGKEGAEHLLEGGGGIDDQVDFRLLFLLWA